MKILSLFTVLPLAIAPLSVLTTPVAAQTAADATLAQQRACQNRAAEVYPTTLRNDVQVTPVRKGEDGSASLRWQLPDGTYGFCRTSSEARLLEFGVYPGMMTTTAATPNELVQVCQRRLLQEFPSVPTDRLTLSAVAEAKDGATGFKWHIQDGASGFCGVTQAGEIFELGVNVE
jgi:hypothetical protein